VVQGEPQPADVEEGVGGPAPEPADNESWPSPGPIPTRQGETEPSGMSSLGTLGHVLASARDSAQPSITPPQVNVFDAKSSWGQPDGGAEDMEPEEVNRQPPNLHRPKTLEPDYIKVGCYRGPYVMATVDTQVEEAEVVTVQSDLDSAVARMNVSSSLFLVSSMTDKFLRIENHQILSRKGCSA
jgi:hypothetical protein